MTIAGDRIRLARVITRMNIGGPARQALLLTRELADMYDTRLLAGRPPPEEGELVDPAAPPVYVPLVRPPRPMSDARAFAAVRRHLVDHRAALVHTHMAKAGTIGRLAALTVRPRPALVHTFHGHVLDGYFSPRVQRAVLAAERWLASRTDTLVAVSDEVRTDLLERGVGTPERFRVIPLGLDLRAHRRIEGRSGRLREQIGLHDEPLIGIVGRLAPIKDHETLLRAVARLDGVHLAVIGDGESRTAIEAIVDDLRIGGRVHLVGWWLDVPSAMADLDVVALSSRNEGTPVALIEAAACARAVVATDVGGVRSVVADGETGLLVPAGDVRALADALARLLDDASLRDRFGALGRQRTDRFDDTRLCRDLDALYRQLLGRDGEAPRAR